MASPGPPGRSPVVTGWRGLCLVAGNGCFCFRGNDRGVVLAGAGVQAALPGAVRRPLPDGKVKAPHPPPLPSLPGSSRQSMRCPEIPWTTGTSPAVTMETGSGGEPRAFPFSGRTGGFRPAPLRARSGEGVEALARRALSEALIPTRAKKSRSFTALSPVTTGLVPVVHAILRHRLDCRDGARQRRAGDGKPSPLPSARDLQAAGRQQ